MLVDQQAMIDEIKCLPCFVDHVVEVAGISAGLSQHCFNVSLINDLTDKNAHYFVKSLSDSLIENSQVLSAQLAAKLSISPEVIYHNDDWLVTEYIDGRTLDTIQMAVEEKIDIAVSLLRKLHQLTSITSIPRFCVAAMIEQQINQDCFSETQQTFVNVLIQKHLTFPTGTNTGIKTVLCHGDVNFSNIIIDQQQKPWLLDFECAFVGDAEFDIAMFITVNQLSTESVVDSITSYQTQTDCLLSPVLIEEYIVCCYLLNGLWYQGHAQASANKAQYLELAFQQYQGFDQLALCETKLTDLLLP